MWWVGFNMAGLTLYVVLFGVCAALIYGGEWGSVLVVAYVVIVLIGFMEWAAGRLK